MKIIQILRHVSGAGGSTYAQVLKELVNSIDKYDCIVCTADDYMVDKAGNYGFRPEKLGFVHNQCKQKFLKAIEDNVNLIIVANTNTKISDYKFYLDTGKEKGYQVFVTVVENYHQGQNIHGVGVETLLRQEQNIKSSLKLR